MSSPAAGAPEHQIRQHLAGAGAVARAAAEQDGAPEHVGAHVDTASEEDGALTHLFEAALPGYRGWRWAVTLAAVGPDQPVTVSEVVLVPGPDALVAPEWLPWTARVQAGDLGVGDLLPAGADDSRLVPGYLGTELPDDPEIGRLNPELGLGRARVLSGGARLDLARRWRDGERGPAAEMARNAPGPCVTCGFYLPVAGALSGAFGACGNELSPADGQVVHAEYGCGAHSEVEVDSSPTVPVAELVYDDAEVDIAVPRGRRAE